MRLNFPNKIRPLNAAKSISSMTERTLSECQQAVAKLCGYRDLHELEAKVNDGLPFELDQMLTPEAFEQRQADMSKRFAEIFRCGLGDAQYLILQSRLTGDRPYRVNEQLSIIARALRLTQIPIVGTRARGSIGKLKSPGRNGEVVILKRFGRPTYIITHKTANATVANFEYISPRKSLQLFVPMRLYVPYGVWIEEDGTKVLFSRDYFPIWRIDPRGKVSRPNPWERIKYQSSDYFWGDADTPWDDNQVYNRCIERLEALHLLGGLPKLVDVLPSLILEDSILDVVEAVETMKERAMTMH